jgi:AraC-like DNA-binding protein
VSPAPDIKVYFFTPSQGLRPYFTAFYLTEIVTPPGELVEDYLHPEWAALRFTQGAPPLAHVGPGPLKQQWPFVANGPTSKSIHFATGTARIWGIGLQPAGWAKFVPAPADTFANITVDGSTSPAFARFAPLATHIFGSEPDPAAEAARIDRFVSGLIGLSDTKEAQILACHAAILDPELSTVAELRERLDLTTRTLERLCHRYFGFSPQLLLRRQRFVRSLGRFMLESASSWSKALDAHYHDQAQFVRDFRYFMGMTPSEYAALPHPILKPIMFQRIADAGALDPMDLPTVGRYAGGTA